MRALLLEVAPGHPILQHPSVKPYVTSLRAFLDGGNPITDDKFRKMVAHLAGKYERHERDTRPDPGTPIPAAC